MDPRHVIHVLGSLRASGMERMLVSGAPYWQESGWRASIIGQGHDHPFLDELKGAGYPVDIVGDLRKMTELRGFVRVLRVRKPHVVHIHTEAAHGPVCVAARVALPHVGLVRTVHNVFRFEGMTAARRRIQHAMTRAAKTCHVAPSRDVARNERELWGLSCRVIENWVSDEFLSANPRRIQRACSNLPMRIAVVGHCSEIKNHQLLLRAVLDVPGIEVIHIGETSSAPPEEDTLVRELESQSRIRMLGPTTDVARVVASCHLFAMPSLHEGMPVALAEALSLGLPCIISDAPGLRWAACEPGTRIARDLEDWRSLLRRFSQDHEFRASATSEARARVVRNRERFSPRRGVRQYCELYADVARR